MKLHSRCHQCQSGLTWTELAVILFVFLATLLILYLGATSRLACRCGSERSLNILNIRNIQNAVRGHANMKDMKIGEPLDSSLIVSPDGLTGYLKIPRPPQGLPPYTYGSVVPPKGTLYVTNNFDHPKYGFLSPKDYEDW